MTNETTNNSYKRPKRSIVRGLFFLLLAFLLLLGGKALGTIHQTLENFWIEYQSPYDLHDEFIMNKLLTAHRKQLHYITFGLADKWVEEKHKSLVERVKSKIPEGDDVWIEYWYDSEASLWSRDDMEHANERIPLAKKYMDMLMNGHSQVVQFDKAWRFKIWMDLAYYIANNTYISQGDYIEKYDTITKLITQSKTIYKKLDLGYVLNRDGIEVLVPFRILSDRENLYGYLFQLQITYNKFSCSSLIIDDFGNEISNIFNISDKYYGIADKFSSRLKSKVFDTINNDIKRISNDKNNLGKQCPTGRNL